MAPCPHTPANQLVSLLSFMSLPPQSFLLKTLQWPPNSAEKTQPSELAPVASVHSPAHTPQEPCFTLCSSLCVCYPPTPSARSGIFCPQTSSSHPPLTQVSAEPLSYWGFLESMDHGTGGHSAPLKEVKSAKRIRASPSWPHGRSSRHAAHRGSDSGRRNAALPSIRNHFLCLGIPTA